MRGRVGAAAGLGALLLAVLGPAHAGAPTPVAVDREVIGRSVQGRPLTLVRLGDPGAPRKVLVVGAIHGDEGAGRAVADRLLADRVVPAGGRGCSCAARTPTGSSATRA